MEKGSEGTWVEHHLDSSMPLLSSPHYSFGVVTGRHFKRTVSGTLCGWLVLQL